MKFDWVDRFTGHTHLKITFSNHKHGKSACQIVKEDTIVDPARVSNVNFSIDPSRTTVAPQQLRPITPEPEPEEEDPQAGLRLLEHLQPGITSADNVWLGIEHSLDQGTVEQLLGDTIAGTHLTIQAFLALRSARIRTGQHGERAREVAAGLLAIYLHLLDEEILQLLVTECS